LLVLLSGKSVNFYPDIYLLRINTSDIQPSSTDISTLINIPQSIINEVPNSEINEVTQTAAKALGLRDFYVSHIMNYCSGVIVQKGDPPVNDTETTYCSPVTGLYAFNPIDIFEAQLVPGYTIDSLGISDDVKNGAHTLAIAYKVMFICMVLGVGLSGLCILLGVVIGWMESRGIAAFMALISILAVIALAGGAAVATAIAIKLKDVINQYMGGSLNVWANNDGGKLLGLAWASVFAMFLTMVYWTFGCCCGRGAARRRQRREQRKLEMSTTYA